MTKKPAPVSASPAPVVDTVTAQPLPSSGGCYRLDANGNLVPDVGEIPAAPAPETDA